MDGLQSDSIETRPSHGTVGAGAVLGLLSRTGPEAPPDVADSAEPLPWPVFDDEPTQQLPLVAEPRPPAVAAEETPPAKVEARAVIVYQPEPRRSWGLWVLTAILVALTVGVVLGQTVAGEPPSVAAAARTDPSAAGYRTPPYTVPSPLPSGQTLPVTGRRVTAPLGSARALRLEVTGGSTLVTVRSADLGDRLFDIATLDGSAVPKVVNGATGPRLELVRTGTPGRIGAEILLNSRVRWTLRLTGGAAEQDIDMRAGGLAAVDLVGGAARAVLRLPIPKGTVPLTVTGGVSELDLEAGSGVPVRVRLGTGAGSAVLDGRASQRVKAGTVLTSSGWQGAPNRYDISVPAKVDALRVTHL
jgi:hypothetical protein